MKIQMIMEKGRNPFRNAIVAAALIERKKVVMSQCFVSFEVDEWMQFMNLAWKACAKCTRDFRGQWCSKRIPVSITMEDGRTFSSSVWYDVESKGLRYVSLY